MTGTPASHQPPPGRPAPPAGPAAPMSLALLLSINQLRVRSQQEWVQRDTLAWEGHLGPGPGRDLSQSDQTR